MRLVARVTGVVAPAIVIAVLVVTILPAFSMDELFSPTPAPAPPPSVPWVDVNPYGANFRLEWEPEEWKVEKSFEMAQAAGIKWAKQQFPWDSLQLSPGPNGYWDERLNKSTWDKYDRIVDLAQKYDIEIIARLDRPPSWTRQDNARPERPPDDVNAYGDFVYDVVNHFKGRIHYYQIWNEPNIYPEWGDQAPDPAAYVRLLKVAWTRAKAADPNVVIISAPLAQTLENSTRNESDLQYLEGMYEAGAKPYFDVLFANAYGFAFPPSDPPDPAKLNFQRVALVRQIMEKNGDAAKPIWFNEFGWDAAPASFAPQDLPWGRVTDQQQAQYTIDAINFARANWSWAGVFNIWYFRQSGDIPEDRADHYFRMVDEGFTPRPLYYAVQQATGALGVAVPGSYSATDPSANFSGSWTPIQAPGAIGGVVETTSQSGDSLTITFRGGGVNLYVARSPNAGQVYLTVDGREASHVTDRIQGRSVLNLNGSDGSAPELIPITDGLGTGQHTLRLVVGSSTGNEHGSVNVAGFEVKAIDRLSILLKAGAAVLVGAVSVGVALLSIRSLVARR